MDFLRETSSVLMEFCGCDAVEIRLNESDLHYRWEAKQQPQNAVRFERVKWTAVGDGKVIPAAQDDTDLERLCDDVACQRHNLALPIFTRYGSVYIDDTWKPLSVGTETGQETESLCVGGHYRSLILTRFSIGDEIIGLLLIKSEQPNSFVLEEAEFCEEVAQALGLAVAAWLSQAALRERIKELTCLYGIARAVERHGTNAQEVLQRIVELLPPAWQYPENAAAKITLDGISYVTSGFRQNKHSQSADIVIAGVRRGSVEIVYREDRPELAAGVFLKEEEELIEAVAREVGRFIERKEAGEEKTKLQSQLIHADRLATIGQLAAGVAHELNEPLGGILGFAQLAKKCPELPEPAERDIEKIVTASLYAREIIKKLMVFARQMPAKMTQANLNQLVEDGLYFMEARCSKSGIQVVRKLAPDIPDIVADPAQLKQVLVNLVVNAMQAMPKGGTLTVCTEARSSSVLLCVKDTGVGIREEILEKIFLPFFTTKDVDEGTGLGLPVVHGIIEAHGGSIEIKSRSGGGTRFDIRLPVSGPEAIQEDAQDGTSS
jgi:signal transduction histidine kinase